MLRPARDSDLSRESDGERPGNLALILGIQHESLKAAGGEGDGGRKRRRRRVDEHVGQRQRWTHTIDLCSGPSSNVSVNGHGDWTQPGCASATS